MRDEVRLPGVEAAARHTPESQSKRANAANGTENKPPDGYVVKDATGQALAYCNGDEKRAEADIAKR